MMPNKDWAWLLKIKSRLYAAAPRGNRPRPVITSVQLVELGMALMKESKISADKPIAMVDAVRYRDGLMIALLAQVPLRPRNSAALEIGCDVIQEGDNWSIVISPNNTKTGTYLDFEIPYFIRGNFATYLALVRPRMLRRSGCRALWVSPKGGRSHTLRSGPSLRGIQLSGLVFVSPHTTSVTQLRRCGLSRDPNRLASRVTFWHMRICGQWKSITIAPEE